MEDQQVLENANFQSHRPISLFFFIFGSDIDTALSLCAVMRQMISDQIWAIEKLMY